MEFERKEKIEVALAPAGSDIDPFKVFAIDGGRPFFLAVRPRFDWDGNEVPLEKRVEIGRIGQDEEGLCFIWNRKPPKGMVEEAIAFVKGGMK